MSYLTESLTYGPRKAVRNLRRIPMLAKTAVRRGVKPALIQAGQMFGDEVRRDVGMVKMGANALADTASNVWERPRPGATRSWDSPPAHPTTTPKPRMVQQGQYHGANYDLTVNEPIPREDIMAARRTMAARKQGAQLPTALAGATVPVVPAQDIPVAAPAMAPGMGLAVAPASRRVIRGGMGMDPKASMVTPSDEAAYAANVNRSAVPGLAGDTMTEYQVDVMGYKPPDKPRPGGVLNAPTVGINTNRGVISSHDASPELVRSAMGLRSGVLTTNQLGKDFLARQRGRAGDVNNPARMMQSVARRRDAMAESDKDRAMAVQGAQIAANQPQMIAGPDGQPVAVVAGGKMGIVPRPKEADAGTMTAEYDGQGNLVKQTQRTPVDPNAPVSVFDAFGQRDPELRSIQSQIDSDSKALAKGDKRSGPDWAWGAKRKERIAKNRAKLQAAVIRRMAPNISDDQLAKAQAYIANAEADGQIVTEELLRALLQGLSS